MVNLFLVRDLALNGSVSREEVEVDRLFEVLGAIGDVLVLELDLALSALVVSGANVAVHDLEREDHVVQGGDVELKVLVPNGIELALLGGGFLISIVVVSVGDE